jgi:hypothetical protein
MEQELFQVRRTLKEALGNMLTSELLFWLALDVFHRARVAMLFRRES